MQQRPRIKYYIFKILYYLLEGGGGERKGTYLKKEDLLERGGGGLNIQITCHVTKISYSL